MQAGMRQKAKQASIVDTVISTSPLCQTMVWMAKECSRPFSAASASPMYPVVPHSFLPFLRPRGRLCPLPSSRTPREAQAELDTFPFTGYSPKADWYSRHSKPSQPPQIQVMTVNPPAFSVFAPFQGYLDRGRCSQAAANTGSQLTYNGPTVH